jgi:hypothetical protein
MTKEQLLGFKPASGLEQRHNQHSERVQDRQHRSQSCDDSAFRGKPQAGWNFRKGHLAPQIGQRPRNPVIAPVAVVPRHTGRKVLGEVARTYLKIADCCRSDINVE